MGDGEYTRERWRTYVYVRVYTLCECVCVCLCVCMRVWCSACTFHVLQPRPCLTEADDGGGGEGGVGHIGQERVLAINVRSGAPSLFYVP